MRGDVAAIIDAGEELSSVTMTNPELNLSRDITEVRLVSIRADLGVRVGERLSVVDADRMRFEGDLRPTFRTRLALWSSDDEPSEVAQGSGA